MEDERLSMMRRIKIQICTGFTAVAMMLSVLSGCVTDGTVDAPVAHEPSVDREPSIVKLEDGREGFLITEVPQLDEDSRKDFYSAVLLLKDEDYDQAIDLLEKVIERSPGITAPYIDIAIAYQRAGKPEQAEEHLNTALQLFPGHPVVCNELGLLYRKTGRFDEARAIYEKALASFPGYYPLHRNLGILCDLYQDDLPCALEHYEIYSNAMPEDKKVKIWIADLRARLGRE